MRHYKGFMTRNETKECITPAFPPSTPEQVCEDRAIFLPLTQDKVTQINDTTLLKGLKEEVENDFVTVETNPENIAYRTNQVRLERGSSIEIQDQLLGKDKWTLNIIYNVFKEWPHEVDEHLILTLPIGQLFLNVLSGTTADLIFKS